MRREFDKVEIKEPPIRELEQGHSCIKSSCWASCGCFTITVIAFLLIIKFVTVPRPKELKEIPDLFPKSIPVYDEQNIEKIIYTSGESRSRAFEVAAYLPKAILIPAYMASENYLPDSLKQIFEDSKDKSGWQRFIYLMSQTITDRRDTIEIEWIDLPAKPDFIESYYQTELRKKDYLYSLLTNRENDIQISFNKNGVDGVIHIEDNPNEPGTDLVKLKISLPVQ
jgi:hypothetical protein